MKSRASARKRVSGASGAVSPPGPLQGARPSVTSASRRKAKADPAVRGRRDMPAPVPRCAGKTRARFGKATAPPPPHPPPRPSSSSSSAARGPEALHTGALRWTCTRPGASPLRPPAPREVPHPEPRRGPEGVGEPAGSKTRRPGGQAFLDPGCVRGGTWTFSPSTSIYLFSSYYALVGPEEVRTLGSGLDGSTSRRPGRARTHSICAPSPSVWEGASQSPDSSPARSTPPSHSYSSGLLSSCF